MNQYWRRKIYFKILFFFFISCRLLLRLEPVAGENEDEFSWTARVPETLSSPFEMINFISNKAKTNFTFCLRKYFCMIFAETTFFPQARSCFSARGKTISWHMPRCILCTNCTSIVHPLTHPILLLALDFLQIYLLNKYWGKFEVCQRVAESVFPFNSEASRRVLD